MSYVGGIIRDRIMYVVIGSIICHQRRQFINSFERRLIFFFCYLHTGRLGLLEVSFDREKEQVNENPFESGDVILLVEHQHCLFVIYGIYSAE